MKAIYIRKKITSNFYLGKFYLMDLEEKEIILESDGEEPIYLSDSLERNVVIENGVYDLTKDFSPNYGNELKIGGKNSDRPWITIRGYEATPYDGSVRIEKIILNIVLEKMDSYPEGIPIYFYNEVSKEEVNGEGEEYNEQY